MNKESVNFLISVLQEALPDFIIKSQSFDIIAPPTAWISVMMPYRETISHNSWGGGTNLVCIIDDEVGEFVERAENDIKYFIERRSMSDPDFIDDLICDIIACSEVGNTFVHHMTLY